MSDAVVFLEPMDPVEPPAPRLPARPAFAVSVAPTVPRDSVRLLWGAVRDLGDVVRDMRSVLTAPRSNMDSASGARAGARAIAALGQWPTPALAALDSVERADRAPTTPVDVPLPAAVEEPRPRPVPVTRVEMAMRRKTFLPHVRVVPTGGLVAWPNEDPFSHNVFSNTPGGEFDLGLYPRGEDRRTGFGRPGVYEIFCNIHSRMSAFVVAVPAPYYAQPADDGRFSIRDVPPGHYRLRAWHERAPAQSKLVTVEPGGMRDVSLTLDARAYRPTPHSNKFGQPYPTARRDEY